MSESTRDAKARRSREVYASLADIGDIPAVANVRRRESCRLNLLRFLVTYFPETTGLSPFSEDHKRVISRIQSCVLDGGRFVNAVYRGFAKTTISENAAIWAVLYGHRAYVPILGANASAADENIESIKLELSENELLAEDFPEVCHAVQALEGKPQRCRSQTHAGELTHIGWTADTVVLPTIRLSQAAAKEKKIPVTADGYTLCSGAILRARGMTAGTRGMKRKRPDGRQQRPDFIILDDPQTDESAGTELQVNKAMRLLKKAIMKLGGHKTPLACVINATVIERGDLIDQLLDAKRNPAWQGERIPMLRSMSKAHETHWLGEYKRLRETYDPDSLDDQKRAHRAANAYYRKHRKEMDEGCRVSWKHCFVSDDEGGRRVPELSAIQHAYNMLIDDGPEAFASECQQQPIDRLAESVSRLDAARIRAKVNGLERGVVPTWATHLTAFVDVGEKLLYWSVMAWGNAFAGAVLDYGTWPPQSRPYFAMKDARPTIASELPGMGLEAQFREALSRLMPSLVGRPWRQGDIGEMRVGRCLIDANYGISTSSVYDFCATSPYAAFLTPSHGKGVGPGERSMLQWDEKPGERLGHNWKQMLPTKRAVRHVMFDSNYWKTFLANRWLTALGDPGSLSLFGRDPEAHALIADHACAEFGDPQTSARTQRTVEVWRAYPHRPDNHWLDCLVGCAVGASMLGVSLPGQGKRDEVKRVRFSELQAKKRG